MVIFQLTPQQVHGVPGPNKIVVNNLDEWHILGLAKTYRQYLKSPMTLFTCNVYFML